MFWSENKIIWYTPAYPSFAIKKWGIGGIHSIVRTCFPDVVAKLGRGAFGFTKYRHLDRGYTTEL